jgi:ribonuclease R
MKTSRKSAPTPSTGTRSRLEALLAHRDFVSATLAELQQRLRLPEGSRTELQSLLRELERAGKVARIKGDRYVRPREADLIPGRIRMTRQGKGFLIPDDPKLEEILVPESATGTALHEDRVLVRRDVPLRGLSGAPEPRSTGAVVRILARRRTRIVGTLRKTQRFLHVVPDDPRIPHDIYVDGERAGGRRARPGDKVVVVLREWEARQSSPEGEIVEVLGHPEDRGVDMLSILRQYDLATGFPRRVLQEASALGGEVRRAELAGREDRRRDPVVTIDPDDAQDFDDAIALQRVSAEQWKLQVHIADVSHYVRPGTALDEEARLRGNSTYLVDRVVPMLPEVLSNGLCSLKPGVDRLTKCMEVLLGRDGRVLKARFFPAVIHSQRRFTYAEAFAVLQRRPRGPIEEMLHAASELAQRIRRRRFRDGALELDSPELKLRLDEHGALARIDRVENDASHQLIEEFMLLANENVAKRLSSLRRPALHRVHEDPDPRRLREYREELLAHGVRCGDLTRRAEVQKLLAHLDTLAIGTALKIGFLRALMRARYAPEPLGHYGLAKQHYTHFTSPIRRYADLLVHRALFESPSVPLAALAETAEHVSLTERNSSDAERASREAKLFSFLEDDLRSGTPTPYAALVTDVRNFGFFVDVPALGLSGLVPVSSLEDDFYVFEPGRGRLLGRKTRRVIALGDELHVQAFRIDRLKKQADFRLVVERAASARKQRPARPGARPGARAAARTPETNERAEPVRASKRRRRRSGSKPA